MTPLRPLAPDTGPFPLPSFLEAWRRHQGRGEWLPVVAGEGAMTLVVEAGRAEFAGSAAVTDYHSPLGHSLDAVVAAAAAALPPGCRLSLDSLPLEAAEPLAKEFAAAGVALAMRAHDATMVLDLTTPEPEAFVAGLDAKARHEVRRKRRRFVERAGTPVLRREAEGLAVFAAMHRRSPGDKGRFLTPDMERFFAALLRDVGGVIDVLRDGDGAAVAAAFGFEEPGTYYLYNSAFDPDRADLSPGILLAVMLLEAAIASGRRRCDLLKGDEDYKVRLGARPRPLYVLEGQR